MPKNPELVFHKGITNATPEEVGYNPERLKQLDLHLADLINNKKLQCASYLLSRYGKTFACKSVGKLTYHEDSPDLLPDSIRRVASNTKIFTSMAAMKLVEDGKLYLEQPVSTIIKEFDTDMHRKITIFQLLTHTSGLRADPGFFLEPYMQNYFGDIENALKKNKKANWIKIALAGPLKANPGEAFMYSSMGMVILGEVITRVSGLHCEQFIIDKIVKPLGMNETFFDVPEDLLHRVCYTNNWQENHLKNKYDRSGKPPRAAGGLNTTLYDINRLGQMFLNMGEYNGNIIISRKSIEAMVKNQLYNMDCLAWGTFCRNMQMGLGIYLGLTDLLTPGTYSHEGAGRFAFYVDPAESLVVSFFVPTNIEWVAESLINTKSIIWSGLL